MGQFATNPIKWEQDVGDGRGKREFYYVPYEKTLYIEPEGISSVDVSQMSPHRRGGHGTEIPGMLAIDAQSVGEQAEFLWKATRPFREHFDVGGVGVELINSENGSELPPQQDNLIPPRTINPPTEQEGQFVMGNPQGVSEPPIIGMDIDQYTRQKYAPLIEMQALVIEIYAELIKTRLTPDDDSHGMVEMLRNKVTGLKETYYDDRSPHTDDEGAGE